MARIRSQSNKRTDVRRQQKLRAGEYSEEDILTGPGAHAAVAIAHLASGTVAAAPRYSIRRFHDGKVSYLVDSLDQWTTRPLDLFNVPHYP